MLEKGSRVSTRERGESGKLSRECVGRRSRLTATFAGSSIQACRAVRGSMRLHR
jgi:hypothetical protein